ncbi:hypothetical protein ATB99_14640 [Elizabethkingia meningoseptica]|uniref:hypothetical protein n=2 Tax=Elizabethkingia meningoseptica TaxID=238 RepID=UPI00036C9BCC|nr:hypothetical protein [Elizabethkingia meningoseptica]AQX05800.1 hypothetical protein BBD33_11325 [Elizabethkingia meningoseptica]AQX47843.1 hypothetical protein B5G46_11315 [Elizabethkingia meningoseptica]KUY23032.1 hypothetical protein ATB99_14640 [Elizabethkingia meningoseptica]OPB71182.1 hypothetical protein BAY30_00995 [Elizabethkingia meningoseptica]SQG05239.1 Uncharacterised protein [Elizabethkingia meningoseptica]
MIIRKFNEKLLDEQVKLRNILLKISFNFDVTNTDFYLEFEKDASSCLENISKIVSSESDTIHFKNYKYLTTSIFHIIKWGNKQFNGIAGGNANLDAAKINIEQINFSICNYSESFSEDLNKFISLIKDLSSVTQIKEAFQKFSSIQFPMYISDEYDPYKRFGSHLSEDNIIKENEHPTTPIVASIDFSIDDEPWANPQVLKPAEIYTINGTVTLNHWPPGYDKLLLHPISAQNKSLYELSLPEIKKGESNKIKGHVVFKYPQHSFEESMVIKLVASLENPKNTILPTIIGYDQLIAKVLDPNANYFLSGFKAMNQVITNIAIKIEQELPMIDRTEKHNFLKLLNGIVNYQGFCLQHGKYKDQPNISEDIFRDDLIQHLVGISYLGENVTKESHLAGGRVEIIYKDIIAELKVEKTISDREKLIKKYSKQPVAYSSAKTKQLSILCILDLTEKKLPPASPQNNIFFIAPELHGFEESEAIFPSRQVILIIDGNTKKPSDYSR